MEVLEQICRHCVVLPRLRDYGDSRILLKPYRKLPVSSTARRWGMPRLKVQTSQGLQLDRRRKTRPIPGSPWEGSERTVRCLSGALQNWHPGEGCTIEPRRVHSAVAPCQSDGTRLYATNFLHLTICRPCLTWEGWGQPRESNGC